MEFLHNKSKIRRRQTIHKHEDSAKLNRYPQLNDNRKLIG